jgi:HPt (histidine-containing phosphotransfer) domain-containing protein
MSAPLYNLDYLKQVFQGNDAMVHRILDLFEVEVPRYFDTMEELAAKGRWRELHPLAHKAKSSIGMLGMLGLQEQILKMEQLSRTGTDDAHLAEVLKEARRSLTAALASLLAGRPHPARATRSHNTAGVQKVEDDRKLYRA